MLWLRGFALGGWKRYDEALADMTKARSMLGDNVLIDPSNRDWFISMLYVAKGDRSGYQAAVRDALHKIPAEPDLEERGTLLWLCTMTPYALDDPTQLADLSTTSCRRIRSTFSRSTTRRRARSSTALANSRKPATA